VELIEKRNEESGIKNGTGEEGEIIIIEAVGAPVRKAMVMVAARRNRNRGAAIVLVLRPIKGLQEEAEVAVVKEVGVTGIVEMGVIGKDTIAVAVVVVVVNEGIDRLQVGMIEIMINGTREKGDGVEMITIQV
jgi:hypothetical protein